jgi:hypothetical protein
MLNFWYQDAVIYEADVTLFQDGNGDGIGQGRLVVLDVEDPAVCASGHVRACRLDSRLSGNNRGAY